MIDRLLEAISKIGQDIIDGINRVAPVTSLASASVLGVPDQKEQQPPSHGTEAMGHSQ